MLGIVLHDDAGRAAYLAGLHVAQALIFEITDKARNRHSGVQREFARLVKERSAFRPSATGVSSANLQSQSHCRL
jgi:hypothetical protein